MTDLFPWIAFYLKGIYDEYTTGDGYGDGDYAYDGYPGNVRNPKARGQTFSAKLKDFYLGNHGDSWS